MAYSASNPPIRTGGGLGGGPRTWMYQSTDIHTTVDDADYFTNGGDLGMKVNDVVTVVKTTATIGATLHVVTAISAAGAATVSAAILA